MKIMKWKGFGGRKCRWGEENKGVGGGIKYKGTWFLYKHLESKVFFLYTQRFATGFLTALILKTASATVYFFQQYNFYCQRAPMFLSKKIKTMI